MPDIFPQESRRVSVSIFERDGLGYPHPDPASRKFQAVETDGFDSPVLAVIRGIEVAFRLGFPGEVMLGCLASASAGIGAGCRAGSCGASIYSRSIELSGCNIGRRGSWPAWRPRQSGEDAGLRRLSAFQRVRIDSLDAWISRITCLPAWLRPRTSLHRASIIFCGPYGV